MFLSGGPVLILVNGRLPGIPSISRGRRSTGRDGAGLYDSRRAFSVLRRRWRQWMGGCVAWEN
jgi:hypothetical protein